MTRTFKCDSFNNLLFYLQRRDWQDGCLNIDGDCSMFDRSKPSSVPTRPDAKHAGPETGHDSDTKSIQVCLRSNINCVQKWKYQTLTRIQPTMKNTPESAFYY